MIKKLVVSFTLATVVFAGPAAASLDSSAYFKNWYEGQWKHSKNEVSRQIVSHSILVGLNWFQWMNEMEQTIVNRLDVTDLIYTTSTEMQDYADAKADRLEEAKLSLHMNELEAFEAERKQNLPEEMEDELEEYFKTEFLTGE